MTLDAWGRPLHCSECGAALPKHPHAGRPRTTCSRACYQQGLNRRRREEKAWMSQPALVETAADAEALREFERWRQA